MKEIILTSEAYVALGLKSNEADGKSISAAIMELQARVEKAEKELEDQRKLKANELVALAIKDGRITADKKEAFEKWPLAIMTLPNHLGGNSCERIVGCKGDALHRQNSHRRRAQRLDLPQMGQGRPRGFEEDEGRRSGSLRGT